MAQAPTASLPDLRSGVNITFITTTQQLFFEVLSIVRIDFGAPFE